MLHERNPIDRNYEAERVKHCLRRSTTDAHPLNTTVIDGSKDSLVNARALKTSLAFLDPLSDPLSGLISVSITNDPMSTTRLSSDKNETVSENVIPSVNPWYLKKSQILREYSVSGSFTVSKYAFDEVPNVNISLPYSA